MDRSKDLSDEVRLNAIKATTSDTTIEYTIVTPPGYFQSVMTLKMSCGKTDIYPGFIDVQSRRASSTEVEHHFAIAGSEAEQNMTEERQEKEIQKASGSGAQLRIAQLRPATVANETLAEEGNSTDASVAVDEGLNEEDLANITSVVEEHVHISDDKVVGDLAKLFK